NRPRRFKCEVPGSVTFVVPRDLNQSQAEQDARPPRGAPRGAPYTPSTMKPPPKLSTRQTRLSQKFGQQSKPPRQRHPIPPAPPEPWPPKMRTEEVAGVLRRRTRSVYKLVYQGVLRPLPGRPLLFDRDEVRTLLTEGIPRPQDRGRRPGADV